MPKKVTLEMLNAVSEKDFSSIWWDFCQEEIGELPQRVYDFEYDKLVKTDNLQKTFYNFDCSLVSDLYNSLGIEADGNFIKAIIEGNVNKDHKYIIAHYGKLYTSDSARDLAKMSEYYNEQDILDYINDNLDNSDYIEMFHLTRDYRVKFTTTVTFYVEVEATDEDEAEEKAREEIDNSWGITDFDYYADDDYYCEEIFED